MYFENKPVGRYRYAFSKIYFAAISAFVCGCVCVKNLWNHFMFEKDFDWTGGVSTKHCTHHLYQHVFCNAVTLHSFHKNLQVSLLVNKFCKFWDIYLGHSHNFHTKDVTWKSKNLTSKCIFQNYSQFLDIFTQLILKTTVNLLFQVYNLTKTDLTVAASVSMFVMLSFSVKGIFLLVNSADQFSFILILKTWLNGPE